MAPGTPLRPAQLIPPDPEYKEVINQLASIAAGTMEQWPVWRDSLLRVMCERFGADNNFHLSASSNSSEDWVEMASGASMPDMEGE